jgi:DNA mismatch repair ATPase MutL
MSIGYRGEALCSLARCSELKVITRHISARQAVEISYDESGQVREIIEVDKEKPGTIVQVRNIHKINEKNQFFFKKNIKNHFN